MNRLGNGKPGKWVPSPDAGLKQHHERQFAWWAVFNELAPVPSNHPASYFNKKYRDAIEF